MPPVNASLADDWIRHAVLMERFKTGELKKLMAFLNKEVMPDIIAKADKIATRYQQMGYTKLSLARRRRALMKQLRGMERVIQGGTNLLHARIKGSLSTLAKTEAAWAAKTLQRSLPLRLNYTLPSPDLMRSIVTARPMQGKFLRQWTKEIGANTAKRVNQAIMVGVAQGEGVGPIIRRIRGTAAGGFKDGVLQATRHEAQMVARTAINHVGNHAREAVFAENKDVVEKVQWLSVLDSRTSQICASLDSQTYEINKGPRPPAHPNCRSVMIPVVKPPKDIPGIDASKLPPGERAAMGGPVPGDIKFGRWLKGQPAKVQNTILGNAERGRLFRRGNVPIENFASARTLQPISMKRLQSLERKMLSGGASAPSVVTLQQGPYDAFQHIKAMPANKVGPGGWTTQEIMQSIFSETGVMPSKQYLPKMLNKLKAEGLLERPFKSWRLTETGKNIMVKLGKGKKVVKKVKPVTVKPTPTPTPTPQPSVTAIPGETGEQLRARLQILVRENDERVSAIILEEDAVGLKLEKLRMDKRRLRERIEDVEVAAGRSPTRSGWSWYDDPEVVALNKVRESLHVELRLLHRKKMAQAKMKTEILRREIAAGGNAKFKTPYAPKGTKWQTNKDKGVAHTATAEITAKVEDAKAFHNGLWHRPKVEGWSKRVDAMDRWAMQKWLSTNQPKVLDKLMKADMLPSERTEAIRKAMKAPYARKIAAKLDAKGAGAGVQEVEVLVAKDSARAFATPYEGARDGRILIAKGDPTGVIVHELGHTIEFTQHTRAAQMYRAYRASVRTSKGKLKLPPKAQISGPSYPNEVGYPDEFMSPYVGRFYAGGYTEITSMYTEYLYTDALAFMQRDPRGFDFIIDLLRGIPVEKQAWFKALKPLERKWLQSLDKSGYTSATSK